MSLLPNWDDLRYLLAIAEAGSLTRAARRLGVDQATVSRRLRACERHVGTALIERSPKTIALTTAGHCALETAQVMERATAQLQRRVAASVGRISGDLTVTATEVIAKHIVVPALGKLRAEYPSLSFSIVVTNDRLKLSHQEADIAIRLERPTEPGVVGRRMGKLEFSLYASRQEWARPNAKNAPSLSDCCFVGYQSSLAERSSAVGWVDSLDPERVVFRANSTGPIVEAVAAGIGVGSLPRIIGQADPRLCVVSEETRSRPIWLVVHQDLRRSPRVRVGIECLADAFGRMG